MPINPVVSGGPPPRSPPASPAASPEARSARAAAAPAARPGARDTFETGTAPASGSARAKASGGLAPETSVTSSYDVKVGKSGLDVNGSLKLDASLLNKTGKAEQSTEFEYRGEKFRATVALQGNLKIGADANLDLKFHVGTDGALRLDLGANGFAGAKGDLKGTITLESKPSSSPNSAYAPLFEGTADVSAYAGAAVAAEFHLTGDPLHGKVGFEAKAAASVGVGAGFDLGGTLHLLDIASLAKRLGMASLPATAA